jgi:hypothetical protein
VLSPIVAELEAALAADAPLKAADGDVPAHDRYAVELAAIALLRVRRCAAYLELHGIEDERGNLRQAFIEFGRAVEGAARMLDRLGMSPRSRAALGLDLARQADLATALSEPDDGRRAELLREAGLDPSPGGGVIDSADPGSSLPRIDGGNGNG